MFFSSWEILSFIGFVILLVIFPGPNMLLVTQSVGLYGKQAGFYNLAGIITALYIHSIVFALGLSIIIVQSAEAFHLIRTAGAIYLIYLGLSSLWGSLRKKADSGKPCASSDIGSASISANADPLRLSASETHIKSYCKGLLACVLNPKAALFYLSFFPQFLHYQYSVLAQSLIMTLIWSLISASWYTFLIFFLTKFRKALASPKFQQRFGLLTGSALIGIGVKMALPDR